MTHSDSYKVPLLSPALPHARISSPKQGHFKRYSYYYYYYSVREWDPQS